MLLKIFFTLLTRVSSAFGTLILNFVLARYLGAGGVGLFSLGLSIIGFLAIISKFGMDTAILRFISIPFNQGDADIYNNIKSQALNLSLILSIIGFLLLLFLNKNFLNNLFSEPQLEEVIYYMAFLLPPYVFVYIQSSFMKSIGKAWIAPFFEIGGISFLSTIFILIFVTFGIEIDLNLSINLVTISSITICIIGWVVIKICEKNKFKIWNKSSKTNEFYKSLPDFAIISVLGYFTQSGVILMMGRYLPSEEIGLFSVAFRIALAVNFILIVVNSVLAPKFAILYYSEGKKELGYLASKSTFLMTLFCVPVSIFIFIFSKEILSLFGAEFSIASNYLRIFIVAQIVNVGTGSVSYLLNMTGYQRTNRNINLIMALFNIVLCLILIPRIGVLGAVISLSTIIVLKNLISAFFAYKKLNINIFNWTHLYDFKNF